MTSHSLKFSFVPSVSLSSKSPFDQSPPASEVSIENRVQTGLSRLLTFYKWPSEFFSSLEEWFKDLIPLLVDGLRKKLSTRPPSTHEWVIKNYIKCTYDNLRATLDIYKDCFEPCQCDLVRAILVGGDVSGLPGFYTTPLHIIARTESASHWRGPGGIWNREVHSVPEAVKIIDQLIKSKADPYQEDIYGKIPIDYATEGDIIAALVHCQGKRKARACLPRPVSEPIPMPPPPPKAPAVETAPPPKAPIVETALPPAPTVADLEAEIIKAVMEGRFDDVPDIQNKLDALKLKGALADEDDDEPDFIGAGGQEIVPSDDDEPDFIGAGGQEIVSPIVPASTPTPPEWCVKGAIVLYTSTGEEWRIVAVHPPMPDDSTTFVTISFDGSDSTKETSVDKLSPELDESDDDYEGVCPFRSADCDCYYSVCEKCQDSCQRPVRGYLCGQCTFCKSLPSDY